MDSKHTPAPWRLCYADGQIDGADGSTVRRFAWSSYKEFAALPAVEQANIRRTVACVNACEGIDDPAAALRAAREALEWTLQKGEQHEWLPCKSAERIRAALALLGGAS
jgi:hypothetical protein